MVKDKIAIVGSGNMGQAIALGLLKEKLVVGKNLIMADPFLDKLSYFGQQGVLLEKDNKKAVKNAEVIILAVKPQIMQLVLEEIKDVVVFSQLIISIAAGIKIKGIKKTLGEKMPIIRVMPNLGAKVGASMSVWTKSRKVSKDQVKVAKEILGAIGDEILLKKEADLDKITAISGSGPAYFFYLTELLEYSSMKLGLTQSVSRKLVLQTIIGAAALLVQSDISPADLRKQVTSKGGTTEAAISTMEKSKLDKIVTKAVLSAYKRAGEISHTFTS